VIGLNWYWISIMATAPLLAGLIVGYLFWRSGDSIFGNLAATGIIFTSAFGMIWREHLHIDRIVKDCLDAGNPCWPEPAPFTRYAIYAFIGLFEVFVVFWTSLRVEERIRNRDYAPEWR
jgi:hypothetical protein